MGTNLSRFLRLLHSREHAYCLPFDSQIMSEFTPWSLRTRAVIAVSQIKTASSDIKKSVWLEPKRENTERQSGAVPLSGRPHEPVR